MSNSKTVSTISEVLSKTHVKMLVEESAISHERILERGYWTETDEEVLERLGFEDYQIRVPALVIPIRNVTGEVVLHRIRPNDPRPDRKKSWKVVKYDQPPNSPVVLDVSRCARTGPGEPAKHGYASGAHRR